MHWASESPSRCLVGKPTLKTQQMLFHSALNRTVRCARGDALTQPCTVAPQTEAERLRVTVAEAAAASELPEATPQPTASPQRARACDLSAKHSHPLVPCMRRRRWQEEAAENRRKRAAQQQKKRFQGTRALLLCIAVAPFTVAMTRPMGSITDRWLGHTCCLFRGFSPCVWH